MCQYAHMQMGTLSACELRLSGLALDSAFFSYFAGHGL